MARRSAVRSGRETADVEEAQAPGRDAAFDADPWEPPRAGRKGRRPGDDDGGGGGVQGGRYRGSGGRWWVWVGRAILWALIIVILVNGIRAPFERFTASEEPGGTGGAPASGRPGGYPVSAAGAFALQFADVYFNYDQASAPAREARLRAFLPEGADAQFGWNGVGKLAVQSVQVAGVEPHGGGNATVMLLARSDDRWLRLAVPVFERGGSFVVAGRPALLPPPAKAALPQRGVADRDGALEGELTPVLGTFFKAYGEGDAASLARFSAGSPITGLNRTVNLVQVRSVIAPRGSDDARVVTSTVAWQIPSAGSGTGGELEQEYRLSLTKKGGTWYVKDIRGITEPSTP